MSQPSRRTFVTGAGAIAMGSTAIQPLPSHAQGKDGTDHQAFVRLSSVLTGLKESELPGMVEQSDISGTRLKLYEIYFERLRAGYPAELSELLTAWRSVEDNADPEAALTAKLGTSDEAALRMRVAARQIIKIWYLSTIDDPRTGLDAKGRSKGQLGGDLGQYQQSAIWPLIGAPVAGYSNFPHGYWQHQPKLPPSS
jgi:hypothetical protein